MFGLVTNVLRNWRRRHFERRKSQARIKSIAPHMPVGGVGAELGVFEGAFSVLLFRALRPQKMHLIDPWYHLQSHWKWASGSPSTVTALRRIMRRWQHELETGQVVVHIDSDLAVLERFDDNYLDWAYIDSSHAYEHTKLELEILRRKVKPGGCIAGDDWRPDPQHRHYGVSVAVNEAIAAGFLHVKSIDEKTAQWVTTLVK